MIDNNYAFKERSPKDIQHLDKIARKNYYKYFRHYCNISLWIRTLHVYVMSFFIDC